MVFYDLSIEVPGRINREMGAHSLYDQSITTLGSTYLNVRTDVGAAAFQAGLEANGFTFVRRTITSNGFVVILRKEKRSGPFTREAAQAVSAPSAPHRKGSSNTRWGVLELMNRHERRPPLAGSTVRRMRAFRNVADGLVADVMLPEQVLAAKASHVFFLEADSVTSEYLVPVVHRLCEAESSSVSCLLNLTRTDRTSGESAAAFYIDAGTTAADYRTRLTEGEPATAWIYAKADYGCASDEGRWLIYSEGQNDVALIAFFDADVEKYATALRELGAERIENLIGTNMLPHFSALIPEWRHELMQNYSESRMQPAT